MTFANHLGTKIFYQVVGNGLPLVMIPGALASYKDFFDCGYVSALKNKYKLILIDMRGFGKSSKPHQGNEYSFKLMVEDIIAVLDDLEIDRCHIYGHSLGGWLVWGLAIFYPERLQSIIIADGAPGSDDPTGFRYVAENLDEWVAKSETPQPFKDRLLANDRQALSAIVDWQFKEISSIIELINTSLKNLSLLLVVIFVDKFL